MAEKLRIEKENVARLTAMVEDLASGGVYGKKSDMNTQTREGKDGRMMTRATFDKREEQFGEGATRRVRMESLQANKNNSSPRGASQNKNRNSYGLGMSSREDQTVRRNDYRFMEREKDLNPDFTRPPPAQERRKQDREELHPTVAKYASHMTNYGLDLMRNPYEIAEDRPGAQFYRELPCPFDVAPPETATAVTDFKKLEAVCPKFGGNEREFYAWAFLFVPTIHIANCPIYWKTSLLIKCLNAENARLKELTNGIGQAKEDYARLLKRLVDWFGHPRGILAARLQALEEVGRVSHNDLDTLEKIFVRLEDYCEITRQFGRTNDLSSHHLYEETFQKMDTILKQRYLTWTNWKQQKRDALTLLAWMDEAILEAREMRRGTRLSTEHKSFAAIGQEMGWKCPIDGGRHAIARCGTFLEMTPFERRKKARELQMCYACLKEGHQISSCSQAVVCPKCPNHHHPLLHGSNTRRNRRGNVNVAAEVDDEEDYWSEDSSVEEDVVFKANYQVPSTRNKKVVLQTIPAILGNPEKGLKVEANVMMDPGATSSFLSVNLAKKLKLEGKLRSTTIVGFGGKKFEGRIAFAMVQIAPIFKEDVKFWTPVQIITDPAASYQPHNWRLDKHKYDHLANLPISAPVPGPVEMMLGMDAPHLIMSVEKDRGGKSAQQPIARLTKLGWVVGRPS